MKFTTIVFSAALIAGAVAQSTSETVVVTTTATVNTASTGTTTVIPIPTETNSSYGAEVDECMTECKQGDVGCLATCLGSPNPTEEQVNETTKCSAACKQGDGSEEQTKAYGDCQWACVVKYYLPNSSLVPTVGGTKTSGDDTATETDAPGTTTIIETNSEGKPTKTVVNDDSTVTTSGTSAPSASDNSAPGKVYGASVAGAAAAFAAFLAL